MPIAIHIVGGNEVIRYTGGVTPDGSGSWIEKYDVKGAGAISPHHNMWVKFIYRMIWSFTALINQIIAVKDQIIAVKDQIIAEKDQIIAEITEIAILQRELLAIKRSEIQQMDARFLLIRYNTQLIRQYITLMMVGQALFIINMILLLALYV